MKKHFQLIYVIGNLFECSIYLDYLFKATRNVWEMENNNEISVVQRLNQLSCVLSCEIILRQDEQNVTLALYEDVKFMANRLDQVNADAVFGLTLAQVNLAAVLSSPNIEFLFEDELNRIDETELLCDNSRVYVVDKLLQKENYSMASLIQVLTRPEIWMSEISWRKGILQTEFTSSPHLTVMKVISSIFSGTPQAYESDYCLRQLVNDNCEIPDTCVDMLIRNDNSRGYPLAHRLLFVKTALAVNCKENPRTNLSNLIEDYCREIFQNLIDLENFNFPSISQDLAMEQIVLCGMEGYLEFINGHYADLITSWRNQYGCYSALNINQRKGKVRYKKSTNPMDYGCDSHACGVAAAALSLLIRGYVENYLSPTHEIND
ncbi:hypothetical protein PV327_001991 [Microctonus hyperodae]|uniref:Uncharacterized protein n=1 Tax=Microctonus hyperodae TaxID=165561 RepID=A0AA39FET7_MICHY|nr:hypothetical protein PV327_001991 [Microctonus hyperodae]